MLTSGLQLLSAMQSLPARLGFLLAIICSFSVFAAMNEKIVRIPMANVIDSEPVLIVYAAGIVSLEEDASGSPKRRLVPQIIVAAWEDGTIVWSQDKIKGGAPYQSGHVDPEKVSDVLAGICAAAVLPDLTRTSYRGTSAPWSTVAVKSSACNLYWETWHEIFEDSGRSVCVDGVIRPLGVDETLEEARAHSSPEFLAFVEAWETVKETALGLIHEASPNEGEETISFRSNWTTLVLDP